MKKFGKGDRKRLWKDLQNRLSGYYEKITGKGTWKGYRKGSGKKINGVIAILAVLFVCLIVYGQLPNLRHSAEPADATEAQTESGARGETKEDETGESEPDGTAGETGEETAAEGESGESSTEGIIKETMEKETKAEDSAQSAGGQASQADEKNEKEKETKSESKSDSGRKSSQGESQSSAESDSKKTVDSSGQKNTDKGSQSGSGQSGQASGSSQGSTGSSGQKGSGAGSQPSGGSSGNSSAKEGGQNLEGEAQTAPAKGASQLEPGDMSGLNAGTVVSQEDIAKNGAQSYFYIYYLDNTVFNRIYGKSYSEDCDIPKDDLRYVKVLHYGADGKVYVGEMISHKDISICLAKIFWELYNNKYPIEKMTLVDDYNADDLASAGDNNSSCFNYRETSGIGTGLSKHAYGLAVDINPRYNPYAFYDENGQIHCQPENGAEYLDRDKQSPYKVVKDDLCYQLFISHGFSWGGEWGNEKDYMHFYIK